MACENGVALKLAAIGENRKHHRKRRIEKQTSMKTEESINQRQRNGEMKYRLSSVIS